MKKGTEIIKEEYFAIDEDYARLMNQKYSDLYSYMQVVVDYDKKELRTYFRSRWNSKYDVNQVVKF